MARRLLPFSSYPAHNTTDCTSWFVPKAHNYGSEWLPYIGYVQYAGFEPLLDETSQKSKDGAGHN